MFGIVMRLPDWMVRHILDWAEGHQRIREEYARYRPLARCPFAVNVLTHSRQRYRRNLRFYDEPQLRVGGPTFHWVREGILAGERCWPVRRKTLRQHYCSRRKKSGWSIIVCTIATVNFAPLAVTL